MQQSDMDNEPLRCKKRVDLNINWARSSVRQSVWLLTRRPRVQIPTGPLLLLNHIRWKNHFIRGKSFETLYFGGKDLTKFSLLNHESVPKHEIMSEGELKSVLSNYFVEKEQLPKIKVHDPVCKEIGATVGDVIKITRKSQTAGEAEYYRFVIE